MKRILLAALLLATSLSYAQLGTTTQIRRGSTLPTTCGGGDIFIKSGASAGFYFNVASGTCSWVGPTTINTSSDVISLFSGCSGAQYLGADGACHSATAAGLADPGSNGIVKRTALNTTAAATSTDVLGLWTGTCNSSSYLRGDGACATPSGGVSSVGGTAPIVSSGGATPAISINNFVGDSGSGGTKGAVPAPAAGDAAASKYLAADGTWSSPTAGSGILPTPASKSLRQIAYSTLSTVTSNVIATNLQTFSSDSSNFWAAAPLYGQFVFAVDEYYAFHGSPSSFTNAQIKNIIDKFIAAKDGSGNFPIALKADATAYVFYSGCQSVHTTVTGDGAFFLPQMYKQYLDQGGSTTGASTLMANLKAAIDNVPLDGTTHLVNSASSNEWVDWGFHDGIKKQGNVLMGSLLYYKAAKDMAAIYTSLGDSTNASTMNTRASNIAASLTTGSALWNSTDGMFYAATSNNVQDDILGSAYAVYLNNLYSGLLSGPQVTAISTYLVTNYSTVFSNGFSRQSPSNWGTSWTVSGTAQCQRGTGNYDDGYWSVGNEWIIYTLAQTSTTAANNYIQDFMTNPAKTLEWFSSTGTGFLSNLASPMGTYAATWPTAQFFDKPLVENVDYLSPSQFQVGYQFVGTDVGGAYAVGAINGSALQILVFQFNVYRSYLPLGRMAIDVTTSAGGSTICWGIYDAKTLNKVVSADGVSSASTGAKSVATNVNLPAGTYYLAQTASSTSVQAAQMSLSSAAGVSTLLNYQTGLAITGIPRTGSASTAAAAGCVMPSNLGTITGATVYPMLVMLEGASSR